MSPTELKEWRKTLGYTQVEAAEKLGVSRVTVQNWEGGATPIPPALQSHCAELERRWKQRKLEYGPVALLYCDGPMTQPLWGPGRIPMMYREPWRTMKEALERACELTGFDKFQHALIVDEKITIWGSSELARECRNRINRGTESNVGDLPTNRDNRC
jgi:transcriptional regulator with XRE-family HTH domain